MMKKLLLSAVVVMMAGLLRAESVSPERAMALGQKFVSANFTSLSNASVTLVYTLADEEGMPCLYVMNHEKGFVIIAADDVAKPILAYSDEGQFDVNNIPDGLAYYLDFYKRQIKMVVEQKVPQDAETAQEWRDLAVNGLPQKRDAKVVSPMLTTTWDQDSPYNYYCPSTSNGPGGRAYAGCVATAMSQVMKYWNWPVQGTGSHSYVVNMDGSELNGLQLSADFSTATYDWSNMPNALGWSPTNVQRNAVALLMYHCGISVDMGYSASGSGTQSAKVPNALRTYFSYSSLSQIVSRNQHSKTEFEDILIENLDCGFPTDYSGSSSSSGGHAFVVDGYDTNRKFHFNWGWSSSGDGYFAIDALNPTVWYQSYNFNEYQTAIIKIMPDYVGQSLPKAPDPFTVEPEAPTSLNGVVSWTNPTKSWDNTTLTSLSKVVLMRNGSVIKTYTSVQPGQEMTFNDNVPSFGVYEYTVYAESQYGKGYEANVRALYGPSCEWCFMCSSNSTQGWPGGGLTIYNASNAIVAEFTLTSSGLKSAYFAIPEEAVSIKWTQPTTTVSNVTILVKNEAGQIIVNHTNMSSTAIPAVVYSGVNECAACAKPVGLDAEVTQQSSSWGVRLEWNNGGDNNPSKYYIYRSADGVEYTKIGEVSGTTNTYFDPVEGDYYYKVTAKYSGCESDYGITSGGEDFVHITVTGIEEQVQPVMLYPNPASDKLYVKGNGIQTVTVYNIVGQMVHHSDNDGNALVIDLLEMPSGVYMVKVKTASDEVVRRVSVVR